PQDSSSARDVPNVGATTQQPGRRDMPEHRIQLTNVTKRFRKPDGGVYTALRELSMTVAPGEFCAVVGPTGCGKSTTLSLVSGLEPASAGEVRIDGVPVT